MGIEKFGGFEPLAKKYSKLEKMEGYYSKIWNKTKKLLDKIKGGVEDDDMENSAVERIEDIEEGNEDCLFLDIEVKKGDELLNLRTVGQIDAEYDPKREKDYNNWDLSTQEEAERWLNREILVNEKFNKFYTGENILADEMKEANRDTDSGDMFILKKTKEQDKELEEYGEAEGKALAKTMLSMQSNLNATEMMKEIMSEEGIKNKTELEQKIFEDYFDNFDGYMENSEVILGDLDNQNFAKDIKNKMLSYEKLIKTCQLKKDEYALVQGNMNFDTVVFDDDKAYLSDWQRSGTTQNQELSLVYDLGDILNETAEKFNSQEQVDSFIKGMEMEIAGHYEKNPEIGSAVINLAKLRSFSMIANENATAKKKIEDILYSSK